MNEPCKMDCKEVFKRLDDFLDRALTEEEQHQVQEHLDICVHCASEQAFCADFVADIKAKLRRIHASETLRNRISELLSSEP